MTQGRWRLYSSAHENANFWILGFFFLWQADSSVQITHNYIGGMICKGNGLKNAIFVVGWIWVLTKNIIISKIVLIILSNVNNFLKKINVTSTSAENYLTFLIKMGVFILFVWMRHTLKWWKSFRICNFKISPRAWKVIFSLVHTRDDQLLSQKSRVELFPRFYFILK